MRYFFCLLLILWQNVGTAQQVKQVFRKLTVDQGLTHTDATDLVQDQKGFVWIATLAGLNRYDGHEMKSYISSQQRFNNVYLNRINRLSLLETSIFMATQGGLAEFDLRTEKIITYEAKDAPTKALITNSLSNLLAWTNSLIWVIREGKVYLLQIDRTTQQIKTLTVNLPKTFVGTSLAVDPLGNAWIGGNQGVFRVSKHSKTFDLQSVSLQSTDSQPIQQIESLHFQENRFIIGGINRVWVSENPSFQANVFKGNVFPFASQKLSVSDELSVVVSSIVASQNQIWLGTPVGLLCLQAGQFVELPALKTISSNHISNLMTDASGCLWAGTYGGGVNLLDLNPKPFYTLNLNQFTNPSGTNPNYIRAILEDDLTGNLWVGTRNAGLIYHDFKQQKSTQFLHQSGNVNSLISNNIRSIAKDKKGRIWVGTEAGISLIENNRFQHLTHQPNNPNSLTNNVIYSIAVDVFGQVWAGSWTNGLNRITENNGRFDIEQIYEGKNGISSSKVTFIYTDPLRPEVLVGTTKGLDHIFLQSNGRIARVLHYQGSANYAKSLSSNFIWPIVRSDELTFWVGTIGGGLNKVTLLGNGHYEAESFTTENGLPSNDVEGLLLDNQGNLWLGGKGLSMFNPQTHEFINFDQNDGLQGNVFKIGAATKGRDGKLYFGGVNGLNFFYPNQIKRSQYVPNVVVSDVLVNNKPFKELPAAIPNLNELTFNYLQNNFILKFSSLDYANSDKCHYRYQLMGFDKNWIETDNRSPQAAYSNLEYGEYTFQLIATNHDGVWLNKPTLLKIVVSPPWWKSTLAKLLYLTLLSVIIWMIYQYQARWFKLKNNLEIKEIEERKAEEIHQMRLQFFTNISHELRTPLSLILSPVEKLLHESMSDETRTKYYQIIHRSSSRLLTLVNELMDFRKAEAGVTKLRASETFLNPFLNDICAEFEEVATEKKLDFQLKLPTQDEKLWIDRGIVEKILVNIISNAIKYTDAHKSILVETATSPTPFFQHTHQIGVLQNTHQYAWIRVLDNGMGIPSQDLEHVFDRYYRVTEAEKQKMLGSGIGLALVRSLILLHQGVIKISSKLGQGTEFLVGIPKGTSHFKPEELLTIPDYQLDDSSIKALETKQFLEESFEQISENQHQNDKPQIKKLLIVEDNDELRHFLADSFMGQYHVVEATDGLMGWNLAQEELPDLIISDIMMPQMDGVELCQRIKDNLDTSHTPVILLTAKTSDESKIAGSESGADAYLTKPFSFKLLQITINNLLESRRKLKELYAHDALVEAREVGTTKRDKEFIDLIIKVVEKNLDNTELEIEDIAREVGMSRSKLYTKIHSLTGQPVGDFVRKIRLKTAAKMIVSEDVSITEVMERVGIQSQSYFTKAFKKEFGKTPTQYLHDFVVESEMNKSV